MEATNPAGGPALLDPLRAGAAVPITGWNRSASALGSLPYGLGALGMSGCSLSAGADVLFIMSGSGGTANDAVWIPPSHATSRRWCSIPVPAILRAA